MTNAQPISRPSAAHSAKNATAPGLPNQSRNDSKGTHMVSQTILHQAAQRTGYRVQLVAAPVEVITRRHRSGESLAEIVAYLRAHLGPENRVTARDFVEWVIAATGGEAR